MAKKAPVSTGLSVGELIPSFALSLTSDKKSPKTLRAYLSAAEGFDSFLAESGLPREAMEIRRGHLEAFMADQHARGLSPATVNQRYRSLQQFWKWALAEEEIEKNPMANMNPPALPDNPVRVLKEPQRKALVAACAGKDFESKRDTAIILMFLASGPRLAELTNLRLRRDEGESDLHLDAPGGPQVWVIGKGKGGGRPRAIPLDPPAAQALDRYLRLRRRHTHAALPWLWLGPKGRLTDSGIRQMVERRGIQAGIGHVHPHMLRHSFAHHALKRGMAESHLMKITGWKSRSMVSRYASSTAEERAIEEYQRLFAGGGS